MGNGSADGKGLIGLDPPRSLGFVRGCRQIRLDRQRNDGWGERRLVSFLEFLLQP